MSQRPVLFKWRHFEPQIILCAVRWYLRYSLSYREVQELLEERGVQVDHSTIWRWFAPVSNSTPANFLFLSAEKAGQHRSQ